MNKPLYTKDDLKMPQEQFGTAPEGHTPSHFGIILGILIVVLILILGGLYVWGEMIQKEIEQKQVDHANRPTPAENNEPESNNAEADVETLGAMSTSDEVDAIEADLESTIINELNTDLISIEAELGVQP